MNTRKAPYKARKPRQAPEHRVAPPTHVVGRHRRPANVEDQARQETTAEALKKIELEMARRDRGWR